MFFTKFEMQQGWGKSKCQTSKGKGFPEIHCCFFKDTVLFHVKAAQTLWKINKSIRKGLGRFAWDFAFYFSPSLRLICMTLFFCVGTHLCASSIVIIRVITAIHLHLTPLFSHISHITCFYPIQHSGANYNKRNNTKLYVQHSRRRHGSSSHHRGRPNQSVKWSRDRPRRCRTCPNWVPEDRGAGWKIGKRQHTHTIYNAWKRSRFLMWVV